MAYTSYKSGIKAGAEKSLAFTTIDHTANFAIEAGQVLVVNTNGTVSKANNTVDKTKRCLVATEPFNLAEGNDVNNGKIELAYTHIEDRYAFVMSTKADDVGFVAYTSNDVGKVCGLTADGKFIDKANTVELVEITKVVPITSLEKVQRVYFKFL